MPICVSPLLAGVHADDCQISVHAVVDYPPSTCRSLARIPVIDRHTKIGSRTEVMPFALIYRSAWVGADCLIGSHATVREGATIGDRCVIGQYVCISYDAELADEVRVQNGTLIADGWKIGRGTFIGVNVSTMSDRRRDVVAYEFKGSTPSVIGERCLIGSGAVILPGLRIGDGAVIGAGALIVRDVPAGATVLGEPGRLSMPERLRASYTVHGVDHWTQGERNRA
jgi:acetyltransferase-like isoleucine patch superfamily enzyme